MHHGTILFRSDPTIISNALRVDRDKLESKGVKSVVSRVANLIDYLPEGTTLADFKQRLLEEVARSEPVQTLTLSEDALRTIDGIKRSRYDTWEWNYGRSPGYTDRRSSRIPGVGKVEISLEVKGGVMRELQFFGDFFENSDVSALAELLRGCLCRRDAILARLAGHDPADYIRGLTAEALAELLAAQ